MAECWRWLVRVLAIDQDKDQLFEFEGSLSHPILRHAVCSQGRDDCI